MTDKPKSGGATDSINALVRSPLEGVAYRKGKVAAKKGGRNRNPYSFDPSEFTDEKHGIYNWWLIGYTEHLLPND